MGSSGGLAGTTNPGGTLPYDTSIPGTPQAIQANNIAKQAYQNSLARIKQKRGNTLLSAGYTADFDPNGAYTNLRVDPNNASGGLQQMLRSQALSAQNAQFLNQERGLHGGLANQAQSELQNEAGVQAADFGRGLVGDLNTSIADQRDAVVTYNNALYQAQLEAARLAIANQNYPPGTSPPGDTPPGDTAGGDAGGQDPATAAFLAWLQSQSAAAGQWRPGARRGTYVN